MTVGDEDAGLRGMTLETGRKRPTETDTQTGRKRQAERDRQRQTHRQIERDTYR